MQMMDNSGKLKKVTRSGFVHRGFDSAPWHRGQQMINIRNMHHFHIKIHNRGYRNKYASSVWHNTGNTGCGCRTAKRRFEY